MRGLKLNANLDGATFLGEFRTAPRYRIYSIGDVHPGMFEVDEGGISVPGELYELPDEVWARVEAGEPPGLYRGPVELADGRVVPGILFPRELAEGIHAISPSSAAGASTGRRDRKRAHRQRSEQRRTFQEAGHTTGPRGAEWPGGPSTWPYPRSVQVRLNRFRQKEPPRP